MENKFKKLEQLDKLEGIERRLELLESRLSDSFTANTNKLIAALGGSDIHIPSDNQINDEKVAKMGIGRYLLTSLKVGAYLIILSIGIFAILQYFKIVN